MARQQTKNKGHDMEEWLRSYFLKSGYFVVRGVPYVYGGFDITDIDLWLYGRPSSLTREITIVDAKNRKTPQAIERIFWVQGLKQAVHANNCVIATTDRRDEVKSFGKDLGVLVLDGNFLGKLERSDKKTETRLTDESFFDLIDNYEFEKNDGDWKGRIKHSKSLLAKGLSFDTCNEWLSHGKFFALQSMIKPKHRTTSLRCLLLICSFILISVDYCMREISFLEQHERAKHLQDGFMYGSKGLDGFNKILSIATALVEQNALEGKEIAYQVRANIEKNLDSMNVKTLSEFFSRNDVIKSLFHIARDLESYAMASNFREINEMSIESRSVIYCFADYWGLDRVTLSNTEKHI